MKEMIIFFMLIGSDTIRRTASVIAHSRILNQNVWHRPIAAFETSPAVLGSTAPVLLTA